MYKQKIRNHNHPRTMRIFLCFCFFITFCWFFVLFVFLGNAFRLTFTRSECDWWLLKNYVLGAVWCVCGSSKRSIVLGLCLLGMWNFGSVRRMCDNAVPAVTMGLTIFLFRSRKPVQRASGDARFFARLYDRNSRSDSRGEPGPCCRFPIVLQHNKSLVKWVEAADLWHDIVEEYSRGVFAIWYDLIIFRISRNFRISSSFFFRSFCSS